MGFGKDGKGQILTETQTITLGTLADGTAIKSGAQISLGEDFRIIKSEIFLQGVGFTAKEGVVVGIADNEMSAAEIGEALVVDGPTDRNDREGTEEASRPVWLLAPVDQDQNGFQKVEKTLRWTFSDSEGWTFFAWNMSGSALTTGATVKIQVKHFGVWVT